jgi:hypothetical protein
LKSELANVNELLGAPDNHCKTFVGEDFNHDLNVMHDTSGSLEWIEQHGALAGFCQARNLVIALPSRMDNTEQFDKFLDCSQPFSRIPIGAQLGKPSLIDFVVEDPGESGNTWLDWKDITGDHALSLSSWSLHYNAARKSGPPTWICNDVEKMANYLACHMTHAEFDSPVRAMQVLRGATAMCKDQTTAKMRACYREPWEIKAIRQKLKSAIGVNMRHVWHKKLITAKVAHLSLCNQHKIAEKICDGGVVQRRSSLHPLTRIVAEDDRHITSSREILKVVRSLRDKVVCNGG